MFKILIWCRSRKLIGILVLLVAIILIFLRAGNFLVVGETPIKSYVIVVLSGGSDDRVDLGTKLFKEGYGDYFLFSGKRNTTSPGIKEQLIKSGVQEEKITLEIKSTSTYENALFTKQLLEKDKTQSAIIVTSNYHMRRTRLVFNKVFQGTEIRLTYCASRDENFKPDGWFLDSYSRNIVFSEYIKLVGYWILGRL